MKAKDEDQNLKQQEKEYTKYGTCELGYKKQSTLQNNLQQTGFFGNLGETVTRVSAAAAKAVQQAVIPTDYNSIK